MEFASKLRWALVVIAFVLFLVLVGWGLYSIASNIFRSGSGNNTDTTQVAADVDADLEFASTVRFTQDGKIVARQDHRSYTIEVSANVVSMKIYRGYGQEVIDQVSYQNTPESYNAFIAALDSLGVPDRREGTTTTDDEDYIGTCPTGRRYILEIDSSITRWSTSCSSAQGTAGFSMNSVRSLFQRQIPDFSDITRGVRF